MTNAVVGYLRSRLDLNLTEPTPEEVIVHLAARRFSKALIHETAELLERCAVARFAPSEGEASLVERARRVIQGIEEESCPQ